MSSKKKDAVVPPVIDMTDKDAQGKKVIDLLTNLTAGEQAIVDPYFDDAPEQKPVQSGNEALPLIAPEPIKIAQPLEEPSDEDETKDTEPAFTTQDKVDLSNLEGKVKHHGLEQARAIREIRQRKLWMIYRDENGARKYATYDQYIKEVHGRTRQWATEQTQWLTIVEKLEELHKQGKDVPEMLSANAANSFTHLVEAGNYQGETEEEQEDNGLIAVLQEAVDDGVSLSGENIRKICKRRYDYFNHDRSTLTTKPAATNYDDYKKDLALVEPLKATRDWYNKTRIKELVDGGIMPAEAIRALFKEKMSLPDNEYLLSLATGADLASLVADLAVLAKQIEDIKENERIAKENKAKAKQARETLGIPKRTRKPKVDKTTIAIANTNDDGEPDDTTTYMVELSGDFTKVAGWPLKEEVTHEALLNLFNTLAGKCEILTCESTITVTPVGNAMDEPDEVEDDEVS